MTARYPSSIREEELKNKVAADFFGAFDCTRIIGNVDFCVAAKRSARPESLYWAEAKNHPTDVHGGRGGGEGLLREPLHERLAGGARGGGAHGVRALPGGLVRGNG